MPNVFQSVVKCFAGIIVVLVCMSCHKESMTDGDHSTNFASRAYLIQDSLGDRPIWLMGKASDGWTIAFFPETVSGRIVVLDSLESYPEIRLVTEDGTRWDLFGKGISGPLKGEQLEHPLGMQGYWFAFAAAYKNIKLHGEEEGDPLRIAPFDWGLDYVTSGAAANAIPALDSPEFHSFVYKPSLDQPIDLNPRDIVYGVRIDGMIHLYPERIINWHEIINDVVGGVPMAFVYHPITGTGSAWHRGIRGSFPSFSVSGYVYNNNILAYEEQTGSYWSQILGKSVSGESRGDSIVTFPHLRATWRFWETHFNKYEVLKPHPNFVYLYDEHPLGPTYTSDNQDILFPLYYEDSRLPAKTRVFVVRWNDVVKAYPMSLFQN